MVLSLGRSFIHIRLVLQTACVKGGGQAVLVFEHMRTRAPELCTELSSAMVSDQSIPWMCPSIVGKYPLPRRTLGDCRRSSHVNRVSYLSDDVPQKSFFLEQLNYGKQPRARMRKLYASIQGSCGDQLANLAFSPPAFRPRVRIHRTNPSRACIPHRFDSFTSVANAEFAEACQLVGRPSVL